MLWFFPTNSGLLTCDLCDPASVRSRNSEKFVAPQSQQPRNLGWACWELNRSGFGGIGRIGSVFSSGWWEFNSNDGKNEWKCMGVAFYRQVAASRSCCAISPSPLRHVIKPLLINHASRSPWITGSFLDVWKTTGFAVSLYFTNLYRGSIAVFTFSLQTFCFPVWVQIAAWYCHVFPAEFPRTAS